MMPSLKNIQLTDMQCLCICPTKYLFSLTYRVRLLIVRLLQMRKHILIHLCQIAEHQVSSEHRPRSQSRPDTICHGKQPETSARVQLTAKRYDCRERKIMSSSHGHIPLGEASSGAWSCVWYSCSPPECRPAPRASSSCRHAARSIHLPVRWLRRSANANSVVKCTS